MIFAIFLLFILIVIYYLFIEGYLWKLILAIFGWFGIYVFMEKNIPDSHHLCMTFDNYHFSWSQVVPSIILIFAMACTKKVED